MPPHLRSRARSISIVALVGLVAVGALAAQSVNVPGLGVETVAHLASYPTGMAFLGNGDVLVLEKDTGRVVRIVNGTVLPPVLDVNVEFTGERGLLGITKDPDFLHNGWIYLYYTEAAGSDGGPAIGNHIYRYRWNGSALVEPRLIGALPFSDDGSHNGGVMVFGRDDRLYTVMGDAGHAGQLQNIVTGPSPDDTGAIFRTDGPRLEMIRSRPMPRHYRLRWLVEAVSVIVLLGVLANFARHFAFRPKLLQVEKAP